MSRPRRRRAGLAVSFAAGEEETLVYDSVLDRTVPLAYQQALRDVEPSTLPETGDVDPNSGIDPSQTPAADARDESTQPVPAEIRAIPTDDRSNVPFPSGIIVATTLFTGSDGHHDRMIWAGGAGCDYGRADGCSPGGNQDFPQTGIIIDETLDLDGLQDDTPGSPILLPNTGLITFTGFEAGKVFFATEAGHSGIYFLTTGQATMVYGPDKRSRPR